MYHDHSDPERISLNGHIGYFITGNRRIVATAFSADPEISLIFSFS
jgi:hypothetical protein